MEEPMQTTITARHFTLNDQLRDFINLKLTKLEHYSSYIVNAEIILTKEAGFESIEGKLHLKGELLTSKAIQKDPYQAATEVIDRLLTQMKKHDERMRDRKKNNHTRTAGEPVVSAEED
jgi:putative sigma-54 modulation protein